MSDETMEGTDRRIRLGKLLSQRGIASRRKAEELIRAGLVSLNGQVVTELGTTVDPAADHIKVDGRTLPPEPPKRYFVLYKPRGMVTTRDGEKGRPSVMDLLEDMNLRVEPVGRLDFNAEGALVLTNDGDLANRLSRPSVSIPKRYLAKVYRTPSESDLAAIERGVTFPEGKSRPAKARVVEQTDTDNAWVEITVTEGGPRIVQRIFGQLGHPVSKLRRESFATISIRGLERGQLRELTKEEISRLEDIANGMAPKRAGRGWRGKGFAKPKKVAERKPRRKSP